MTGRRSEKHSGNVHPDDFANLEHVRDKLNEMLKARIAGGLSVSFISQSLGRRHEFMGQVRQPFEADSHGWLYDSFHDLCIGCQAMPRMKIFGLDGFETPLWNMGKVNARYLGIGAQDVMKQFRRQRGISNSELADRLGIVKSGVVRLESADSPYMGSLQKYARASGLIVRFDAIKWLNDDIGGRK